MTETVSVELFPGGCGICGRSFEAGTRVLPTLTPGRATCVVHWDSKTLKKAARQGRVALVLAEGDDA